MATEYSSFYGGRRGASYLIVKQYPTIAAMVEAFQQGGVYTTVGYDEYVIIDTINKNDIDNGKIYRRGYDYNNVMGGAEYIGQVVGPAGMTPHIEMKTIEEVERINENDELIDEEGNSYRRTSGSYAPTENLIPGKYEENGQIKYHDTIEYVACSVRDINSHESTVHLGFKFPYTIIDYTTTLVSAYKDGNYTDTSKATRIDDGNHPFYEKWNISIPKGIKGDTLKNFRVMIADSSIEAYPNQDNDIANSRKVLVYDYYIYDTKEAGTFKTYYLGDYNKISDINITPNGRITISYTHDDTDTYQLRIPISINIKTGDIEGSGNQKVEITYSDGTKEEIGNPINYIIETAIDSRYHLLILYADPKKRQEIKNGGLAASYNGRDDWYDLGYIGNGTGVGAIAGKESDNGIANIASTLPPYSAWFIVEEES